MSQARIERMLDEVRITNYWKIAVLTLVAAVAAVVLGITTLTSEQLTAGETESSSQTGSEFVYFPSQYINQATEPSEHVHAF
jgi:hypothetical protein